MTDSIPAVPRDGGGPGEGSRELAVETRGLVKSFGRRRALEGVDLQVPHGSVYVLVGPNGAGKTMTLRVVLDLVRADAGTARVRGLDTVVDGPGFRGSGGLPGTCRSGRMRATGG